MTQLEPLLVTLDTNAILALANEEAAAPAVRKLIDLQDQRVIKLRVDLSTALENQRPGTTYKLSDVNDLRAFGLGEALYFSGPRPMGFQVESLTNTTIFDSSLTQALLYRIHEIIHPNMPFAWQDYLGAQCMALTIVLKDMLYANWDRHTALYSWVPQPSDDLDHVTIQEYRNRWNRWERKWMNAKNDALGFYNHVTCGGAVFVTSDDHFLKRREALRHVVLPMFLVSLEGSHDLQPHDFHVHISSEILQPDDAVTYILQQIGSLT